MKGLKKSRKYVVNEKQKRKHRFDKILVEDRMVSRQKLELQTLVKKLFSKSWDVNRVFSVLKRYNEKNRFNTERYLVNFENTAYYNETKKLMNSVFDELRLLTNNDPNVEMEFVKNLVKEYLLMPVNYKVNYGVVEVTLTYLREEVMERLNKENRTKLEEFLSNFELAYKNKNWQYLEKVAENLGVKWKKVQDLPPQV